VWVGRGSLAVLDQGLFAGSNFILNLLLARWLAPAQYGAFAVAFSVFLLIGVFHTAVLTEPMLIFGPARYHGRFQGYLGALVRCHFALMLPIAAILTFGAFLLGRLYSATVGQAFLSLAISTPFILLLWLMRRAFYARLAPGWSVAGSAIYLVTLLGCMIFLRSAGRLSPSTGFLAMAAASLVSSLVLAVPHKPTFLLDRGAIRTIVAEHWRYGRWVTAAAVPAWCADSIYYLVLPASAGLAEAGALKALLNLAMPALHAVAALGVLMLPILVEEHGSGSIRAMRRTIGIAMAVFLLISGSYSGVIWECRFDVFRVLYGGRYGDYASWPLLLVGLLPLAQSVQVVAGGALRVLERPSLVFWSSMGGGAATLLLGVPLALHLGVRGALLGLLTSYILMAALTIFFLNRATRIERANNV
jgi:O-antigen/teichoic acid export membrane protein